MKIRVETYVDYKYKPIMDSYGEILKNYYPQEIDKRLYIEIDNLGELFALEYDLYEYCEGLEYNFFFGLMITHDDKEGRFLLIKDNYD